jgi:hypothetical protein
MKLSRQLLCTVLLLLFTAEYVAATTSREVDKAPFAKQFVAHEIQAHFSLLAEESEERDHRDTDLFLLERRLVHPFRVPFHYHGKLRGATSELGTPNAVPRYTLHRSIII